MALPRIYDDEEDDRDQEQRLRPISPVMTENGQPLRPERDVRPSVVFPLEEKEIAGNARRIAEPDASATSKVFPGTAPRLSAVGDEAAPPIGEKPTEELGGRLPQVGDENAGRLKPLTYAQEMRLPTVSPDVPAGSSAFYENKLARLEEPKPEPTTRLGRIGHVLSRIGNVAGDILAPGIMEAIPGTDLNRRFEEGVAQRNLGRAQTRESEERLRGSEELKNIATANAAGTGKTPDEVALAARRRILDAQAANKQPDQGDVDTWNAYADVNQAKLQGKGDESKTPMGPQGVIQHNKQLETLTGGMNPTQKKQFMDAYSIGPNDTHAIATKRGEDAKASAALSGGERDRALQRDIAEKNHQDQVSNRAMEQSGEILRVVDKNNKVSLISREEYDANKGNFISHMKQGPDALKEAQNHATAINEMQARANAFAHDIQNFNWADKGQRNIVRQALSHSGEPGFIDKMLGVPLTQIMASGLKQWGLEGATEDTMRYIIGALSMREAAMGLPKEITGGSRATENSIQALWNTLPESATPSSDWAMEQMKTFQSIVNRLKSTRVPAVPGLPEEPVDSLLGGGAAAGEGGFKNWKNKRGE